MKQTGNKALTPRQQKVLCDQLLLDSLRGLVTDAVDRIEQLEATRVNYDGLAGLTRETKDSIAQRVAYGVPLLASRRSTWLERLCGAGKRMEYILRLERVSYQ